ncbi:hypothetical protein [Pseudobacteriovorax antillogorgiicola]|uniref:Signal transducing protein n=1 Tax=Pseudobacteriovorax antillogorgiicola TaxID=1513793 RepID=A0A1Y6C2M7_9BACT|nr:hypothetical protein [Pseudobacteriovorax antillogorgiicola]TCS50707.1 hypothetical protein EDD56_11290 [Pseudobacteriovorax antillogorgiicola]SMF40575.1 hypothetical protein SAMN06296036_11289 [Pseudobacteriovorax antillogorgiicola]
METIVFKSDSMEKAKVVHSYLVRAGLQARVSEVYESMGNSLNMAFAGFKSFSVSVRSQDREQARAALNDYDMVGMIA